MQNANQRLELLARLCVNRLRPATMKNIFKLAHIRDKDSLHSTCCVCLFFCAHSSLERVVMAEMFSMVFLSFFLFIVCPDDEEN